MGLTYPSNKICPRCGTGGYVWYLDNSEFVAKCINCGHYFRREDFPMCVLDEAPKPISHADRIRAMTDEELAVQIAWPYLASPPWCAEHTTCPYISEDLTPCNKCALEWLKQEAKE